MKLMIIIIKGDEMVEASGDILVGWITLQAGLYKAEIFYGVGVVRIDATKIHGLAPTSEVDLEKGLKTYVYVVDDCWAVEESSDEIEILMEQAFDKIDLFNNN